MDLDRAALLPVDLQRAFDAPPWPRRWNDDLDVNGLRLLDGWRRSGRPLLHVRHDSVEPASTLRPGEPGHAFRPGFEPRRGEPVVGKSVNAAFIGTDLDLRLRRLGIDTVVTFGISTDMCVSTTVRVGTNLGYRVVLVADACDCFDLPDPSGGTIPAETVHAAHVATLRFEFAQVLGVDEVLAVLLGSQDATRPDPARRQPA
jgi:nicotinamidase-related amidase